VNGPVGTIATLASGGSGCASGSGVHGIVTEGATSSAKSFSTPSARISGAASIPKTRSSAQPFASPIGSSIGFLTRLYDSSSSGLSP